MIVSTASLWWTPPAIDQDARTAAVVPRAQPMYASRRGHGVNTSSGPVASGVDQTVCSKSSRAVRAWSTVGVHAGEHSDFTSESIVRTRPVRRSESIGHMIVVLAGRHRHSVGIWFNSPHRLKVQVLLRSHPRILDSCREKSTRNPTHANLCTPPEAACRRPCAAAPRR